MALIESRVPKMLLLFYLKTNFQEFLVAKVISIVVFSFNYSFISSHEFSLKLNMHFLLSISLYTNIYDCRLARCKISRYGSYGLGLYIMLYVECLRFERMFSLSKRSSKAR